MARKPQKDHAQNLSFNVNAAMAKSIELFGTDHAPGASSGTVLVYLRSRRHPVTKKMIHATTHGYPYWPLKIKDPTNYKPKHQQIALQAQQG